MKIRDKYKIEEVENVCFYENAFFSNTCLGIVERSAVGGRIRFYQNNKKYNTNDGKDLSIGNYIPNIEELMNDIYVKFDEKLGISVYEENITQEEYKTFLNVIFNYKTDFIEKSHYDYKGTSGTDWIFRINLTNGERIETTGFHEEPIELMNIRKLFNIYGCNFEIPEKE